MNCSRKKAKRDGDSHRSTLHTPPPYLSIYTYGTILSSHSDAGRSPAQLLLLCMYKSITPGARVQDKTRAAHRAVAMEWNTETTQIRDRPSTLHGVARVASQSLHGTRTLSVVRPCTRLGSRPSCSLAGAPERLNAQRDLTDSTAAVPLLIIIIDSFFRINKR